MTTELQVTIHSNDEEDARVAEEALAAGGQVSVERLPPSRIIDPLTILGVVGGVVGLIDGLLSLRDRWIARKRAVSVRILREDGRELELSDITREELEQFLTPKA
jgi:hypothetical protein